MQAENVVYKVHFKNLSDSQIENYLQLEQPYHCAGSAKSEGLGIAIIEKMVGDDPNALIGLPLIRLIHMLQNEGISVI
jgi:septum formation protein